jgi:hypothetical protein
MAVVMNQPIHFPGRDLPPFGEYVKFEDHVVGEVYFRVGYLDEQLLVPEVTPLVFVGRDLDEENRLKLIVCIFKTSPLTCAATDGEWIIHLLMGRPKSSGSSSS